MNQISLDQATVYAKLVELDDLKKLVEEQRKTIDSLKERIIKLEEIHKVVEELRERVLKVEVDLSVIETCYQSIYNALEINGLMSAGESTVPSAKTEQSQKEPTAAVKEETFTILKFEPQQGAKIGLYDVAYKANNLMDKWNSAYNVLHASNATIKVRYYGPGYVHSYWLYQEGKIYRQKLKPKTQET